MSDFRFDFTALLSSYHWQAARAAVLRPLSQPPPRNTAELVSAHQQALASWRMRLIALRDAGWLRLAVPADLTVDVPLTLQYFRNCPPFGIPIKTISQPCRQVRVCPWCYGRDIVIKAYQAIEWIAFHTDFQEAGLQLVTSTFAKKDCPLPGDNLRLWALDLRKHNWREADKLSGKAAGLGAIVCSVFYPGTVEGTISFRRVAFSLLPAWAEPVLFKGPSTQTTVLPLTTRKELQRQVARALSYPPGLLRDSAATMVRILETLRQLKFHTYRARGVLDNATYQEARARAFAPGPAAMANPDLPSTEAK